MTDTKLATSTKPQDFWLSYLNEAGRFNQWVLSTFASDLGPNVLEVGCGTGNFTVLMAEQGHRVTGIDIDEDYVEMAGRRLFRFPDARVLRADVTSLELDETYDTVVMLDVLEHIRDDISLLVSLKRALCPGGRLILKVPAGQWLYGPMDEAIGHYRRYDKKSLAWTLEAAGFAPIRQHYFNIAGTLGWWLNGRLLKRTTPPGEQLRAFEMLVPAFRLMEGMVPPPFGLSLIASARPA